MTRRDPIRLFVMLGLLLLLGSPALAQDATLSGVATDTSGAVMPRVTIVATHTLSGNRFEVATDERGRYRLALRSGRYRVTAEVPGFFVSISKPDVEVPVGRQAVFNVVLAPSSLRMAVSVTDDAPLLDTSQSKLGGNVDGRQMQELPMSGGDWMQLTLLAPGSHANAVVDSPVTLGFAEGEARFQLNVDGQEVTSTIGGSTQGEPRFSREALAEFELISNRFDATQGRSIGVQMNVVTKSGTNLYTGSASGYFRDDRFIAKDFIVHRVLPYSDQQLAGTAGGPLARDRIHAFAYYEYERQPQSYTFTSPFPRFNIGDLRHTGVDKKAGVRLDAQFRPGARAMVRGNLFSREGILTAGGAGSHPSNASLTNRYNTMLFSSLTTTIGNRAVNELRAGYTWLGGPTYGLVAASGPSLCCSVKRAEDINRSPNIPMITLRGYTIGKRNDAPYDNYELKYSVRESFSSAFDKGGAHHLTAGGEYLFNNNYLYWYQNRDGEIDASGGPVPSNIEELFPVWNDPTTWNVAALSPLVVRYKQSFGTYAVSVPQHIWAAWMQDDWKVTPRLTLNLGLRYDLNQGIFANDIAVPPFLAAGRPSDTDNVGPRLGFAFAPNARTVIRGGSGRFFGWISHFFAHNTVANATFAIPETPNDGRANFAVDPYNGRPPTFQQAIGMRRDLLRSIQSSDMQTPNAWTSSMGVERQIGETMAVQADYVYSASRNEIGSRNTNLSYDAATGAPRPFTNVETRPYPDWGLVAMNFTDGWSNYHGLETAWSKRFNGRWQASATYTLSALHDASGTTALPANVVPDLGGEYTLAVGDQRHRAVLSALYHLPYAFRLSGVYFFGSGQRFATNYGGDLRDTGGTSGGRLRPDGTIVPRNNFVGSPLHRADVRIARRFVVRGRAGVDAIVEVFNLFNHANHGSYVTSESNANYSLPVQNTNVAYQPRLVQFGIRFSL